MYIDPFWGGVIVGVVAMLVFLIFIAIILGRKGDNKDDNI